MLPKELEDIIKMNKGLRNTIKKLYDALSSPEASKSNALAGRLQTVRETAYLLYQKPKKPL